VEEGGFGLEMGTELVAFGRNGERGMRGFVGNGTCRQILRRCEKGDDKRMRRWIG
jgi:hypothetical protein